jgi:septation ring formation regulator EzrA
MYDSNDKDQEAEFTKLFMEFELTPGLQHINTQGQKVQKAIKELADTYHYAGLSVSTAMQTAQRIQEIKFEDVNVDQQARFQTCHQVYIHKIEELLDGFSKTLTAIINQNTFENYLQLVLSIFELILKELKETGAKFYDFLFTTRD